MRSTVHLVNPLWDAGGGSEWRTLSLFEILSDHADVRLWSEQVPDSSLLGSYPIQKIGAGRHPSGGTIVFIGVYFPIGGWYGRARASRTVLVYNTDSPHLLHQVLEGFARQGVKPEIVFASDGLRARTPGVEGGVQVSPIDLSRFQPSPRTGPFTIGRMSRDDSSKHDPADEETYRALVEAGVKVRIMGGTSWSSALGTVPGIELLPAKAEPPDRFLQSLDVFYYRTRPDYYESWGRVVSEAMACGLPVVSGNEGGYRTLLRQAPCGVVVATPKDAVEEILKLREEPRTRAQMGENGRHLIKRLMAQAIEEQIDYYTST